MNEHVGVMNLVLTQHVLDRLLVKMGQCFGAVQLNPAEFGLGNVDVGRVPVQANAHLVELSGDFDTLLLSLSGVEHHQHHVRVLGDCYDLPSSPLSVGSAFDDTGKIQQLNFSVVVVDDSWDARQSGELICGSQRAGIGDGGQEGGLAHRGKAYHADSCISELADFKAFTFDSLSAGL